MTSRRAPLILHLWVAFAFPVGALQEYERPNVAVPELMVRLARRCPLLEIKVLDAVEFHALRLEDDLDRC
jgi:hypothetical protein